MHVAEFPFTLTQLLNNASGELVIYINVSQLHRLQLLAILVIVIKYFGFADRELITFTTHVFDQDGQMKLTTSGYFETVSTVSLLHTKADIGVQLTEQTVAQMTGSDEFSFCTGERAVIDIKLHGDGRLRNLLERNCFRRFRCTQSISDMQI